MMMTRPVTQHVHVAGSTARMSDKIPPRESPPVKKASDEESDPPSTKLSRRQRRNKNKQLFNRQESAKETSHLTQEPSSLLSVTKKDSSRVEGMVPKPKMESLLSIKNAEDGATPKISKEELARLKHELAKSLFGMAADREKWFLKKPAEQKVIRPGSQTRGSDDGRCSNSTSVKGRSIEKKKEGNPPTASGPRSRSIMFRARQPVTNEIRKEKLSPQEEALLQKRRRESLWSYRRVDKSSKKELRQWFQCHTEPVKDDEGSSARRV